MQRPIIHKTSCKCTITTVYYAEVEQNATLTCRWGQAASSVGSSSSGSNSAPVGLEEGGRVLNRFTENYSNNKNVYINITINTSFLLYMAITISTTCLSVLISANSSKHLHPNIMKHDNSIYEYGFSKKGNSVDG